MPSTVFANNMEVSCKAAAGKTICAMPDVCFTPPENPATPPGVPIPYPNTGMASDTTDGSKTVKIGDKEVGLKDKSCFKKSMGDEAGCAAKKGVITSKNMGKVYFNSWSMDVKIEGENAVRHFDLTTNNHASQTGDTPPWPYVDSMSVDDDPCSQEKKKVETACKDKKDPKDRCPEHKPPKEPAGRPKKPSKDASLAVKAKYKKAAEKYKSTSAYKKWRKDEKTYYSRKANENAKDPCLRAMRCMLVPYSPDKGGQRCCPGQTPHHLVEKASFNGVPGTTSYNANKAPCICVEGTSWHLGSHAMMHTVQGNLTQKAMKRNKSDKVTFKQAKKSGSKAASKVFPESGCRQKCIEAQLDKGHKRVKDEKEINGAPSGDTSEKAVKAVEKKVEQKLDRLGSRTGGSGSTR